MVPLKYFAFMTAYLMVLGCAVSLKAQAEPFLDECGSLNQSAEKSYVNFIQDIDDFSAYSGWNSCGDNTVFSMAANKSWANYHAEYASELYVELYSDGGTFATIADTGALQIGLTNMNQFSRMYRCKYQRQQDKVYLYQDGQIYSLKCDQYALNFIQDSGSFEEDDPYYGVNAEISEDGLAYSPVQLKLDRVLWQNYGNYFREFYSASLPEGTNYVRLTLYGYNRLPGGWSDLPNYPMLSRVIITQNEPAVSSEAPDESSSSGQDTSSAPESAASNKTHSDDDHDSAESKRLIRSKNAKTGHSSDGESLPAKKPTENSAQENTEYFSVQADHLPDVSSRDSHLAISSVPLSGPETLPEPDQGLLHFYQGGAEQGGRAFQNFLMPGLIVLQIAAAIFFLKPR